MQSTFETAFAAVQALSKDFEENRRHYLSSGYQESEVRKDFIDKFLVALGWDVHHDRQKNPFEQDVKVERGVNMQGAQKRADYAFFVGPNFRDVRFFVEAKKPFGDIASAQNYFQTIRYGWNAQTPVAVLTDFEQFQILDCRYKPDVDTALSHCIQKFHFSEYADHEKFAVIYHLFSRDAVANGSLDKFAATLPKKRGKAVQRGLFKGGWQSIDEAFLEELDGYRDVLARSFKNRNPQLDGEALTEITQRTIDRLVFIRFLEDKMIHPENLISEFGNKGTAWKDFIAASRKLDGIYNGIVFKQHAILDAASFKVDDGEFADICEKLAHVNSPYDFNSIPIHILGSIYERFLGKVIVTTAKRATLEEKPEVRKAGGVYYTPEYIVRYIVENTVGKQIEGKTPAQIAEMRFADIACGSGSFLLGVFDSLLSYHGKWFNANPDRAKKAGCVLGEDGAWHLSLKQRREILVNNIYGVDIDNQAVEVAQLSLYLKLLEEETTASARQHQLEFHETILPSLNKNIVCGNSLIGTDILTGQLFASDDDRKLNPMDYRQRFPEVMKRGGFDVIVGNPPYIRIQNLQESSPKSVEYLKAHYVSATKGNYDIYVAFVERALSVLNKKGILGYILPHKFFNAKYGEPIRQKLADGRNLLQIVHFTDEQVFSGATTYTCLLFATAEPQKEFDFVRVEKLAEWKQTGKGIAAKISAENATSNEWNFSAGEGGELFKRLEQFPKKIGDVATLFVGLQTSADTVFLFKDSALSCGKNSKVFSKELQKDFELENALLKPVIRSGEIGRYWAMPSALVLFPYDVSSGKASLMEETILKKSFPKTWDYLCENRRLLTEREHGKFAANGWFQLYPKNLDFWEQPKIMIPYMVTRLSAYYDDSSSYFVNVTTGGFGMTVKPNSGVPKYYTGLLNSQLLNWFFKKVSTTFHGGYYAANKQFLVQLPIPSIDLKKSADKTRHNQMVSLVDQMQAARKQLAAAQSDKEKDFYGHRCESLDSNIDALVYELYGLTETEIAIVEGRT